jgi:serine/threonine protein kinase
MERKKLKKLKLQSPLHSCLELPSEETVAEEGCLDQLAGYYKKIGYLAHGVYGITLYVKHLDHKLVIKIIQKDDEGINEVEISCKLSFLKELTPIFTYTHGWVICNGIPEKWNNKIPWGDIEDDNLIKEKKNNENFPFLYLIMDMNEMKFSEFKLISTDDDLIKLLLILCHGLIMTRKKYPFFRHTDIHSGNIMIKKQPAADLSLTFPNVKETVVIKNVEYIPKIIDFGLSKFTNWDKNDKNYKDDFKNWNEDFIDNSGEEISKQHDLFRVFDLIQYTLDQKSRKSENAVLLKNIIEDDFFKQIMLDYTQNNENFIYKFTWYLLNEKFFDNIYYTQKKQNINQKICSRCNINSTKWRYDHSEDYLFCSRECANVFDVFKNYFPIK